MFEEQVQKAYNSTIVSTPIVHNTFYNLNEKIMTLADKIFERFLKSNEKKVIEATERAEAIQEEISPLLKPFNELSLELAAVKNTLEKAFNSQDKENIKFYLKELQKINAIFDDKLFDQLKTVLKAINKSLSL
jgi:DNA-binding transcriptional regulator YhcF (GntR family)